MKFFITAILLFFISFSSFAQTSKELNDSLFNYYDRGEFKKAAAFGEKAVIAAKKESGETHPDYYGSLNNLAFVYDDMGDYEKAERLYIKAIEIQKRVLGENDPDYATSLNNLASLYDRMVQYEKAEHLYMQALGIRKKVLGEEDTLYASSLNNLATFYHNIGRYEKARPLYIQAIKIQKKVLGETNPSYANSLSNLATLYGYMGQYEKAEPMFIQVLEIEKRVLGETHHHYASTLNSLGALYVNMGQYEKAEPMFIQAIGIKKKVLGEEHSSYATSLNNLASLYENMGQYEKAESLYIQAKEIRKKVGRKDDPDYASSLNSLAAFYYHMSQYEKAEPMYIQAIDIWKKVWGENHPNYAIILDNLANLYKEMGRYEKAAPLFLRAMEIEKRVLGETHPDYAISLNNLAVLYQNLGQYKKAEPFLLMNSQIIFKNLKNSFTVLSEKEKGKYLNNNVSIIESNNSFIYHYRKASASILQNNFNQQLVFKSLTLADTKNILASVRQNPDTAVQQLLNDWENNKSILAKQYSMPIAYQRADLKQVETRAEDLEKELTRKSSLFRNQQRANSISLPDVQQGLQQNEVAIEFVSFKLYNKKWTDSTIYAAYILKKNDSVPHFVPLFEEKQLQQLFDKAGKTATSMVNSFYCGAEISTVNKSVETIGQDLYHLVWQPLEPYLKGLKKISYSPAGKLYSIAFQALPVDSTTVLMDKYQLQQYSSTRQIALRNSENIITKPTGIILFGDARFTMDSSQMVNQKINRSEKETISTSIYTPNNTRSSDNNSWKTLPGTAEEVNKIKQLFEQNKISTNTFIQTAASEENLKALNGNSPQILHIATHGFFLPKPDKRNPETGFNEGNAYTLADDPLMRSGLILAGANYAWSGKTPVAGVEDGIATAYEISQLNLSNTELVVLSACETALGDVKGSEGVFGLQRAFRIAGIKKMIVSLWQVPDKETAELMTTFYDYWMKGKTINNAFAEAQADMRKKYAPFYWAAFVLVE